MVPSNDPIARNLAEEASSTIDAIRQDEMEMITRHQDPMKETLDSASGIIAKYNRTQEYRVRRAVASALTAIALAMTTPQAD